MDIKDLINHGIQQPLLDVWEHSGLSKLTSCQIQVLSHGPLWQGKNALVIAPTSSGKTLAGEILAARSAYAMKRAIFLVPFKAIAEEKYREFQKSYAPVGISVVISDGDHTSHDNDIRRGDFGIAVVVFEKMIQLLIQSPGIVADCSLVVIDEIQMIGDSHRGPSLEMLLTHLRSLSPPPQMIGLSATISDLGGLDKWLDADTIHSSVRPVPLWEGVVTPASSLPMENIETEQSRPGLDITRGTIPAGARSMDTKLKTTFKILQTQGFDKQSLVFRTRVDDTISTAKRLAQILPTDAVTSDVRARLNELERTRTTEFLSRWIDKRVAYHNAGLSLEERQMVEQFFNEGIVRVLVTTSTLAAGVNTPADTVVVLDHKRWNNEHKSNLPIPVGEYKNSAGRAGRFSQRTQGHAFLVTTTRNEAHLLQDNYIYGVEAAIKSAIPMLRDRGALVLQFLSMGIISTENELRDSLAGSFAYEYFYNNVSDADTFVENHVSALRELQERGLVSNDDGRLVVTDLGKVASASGVSLSSFYRLIELLKRTADNDEDCEALLPDLCELKEFQPLRPYGDNERAELLDQWLAGTPINDMIDRFSSGYEIGHGNIRMLGYKATWMLNTASQIATELELGCDPEAFSERLTELAMSCKYGVPFSLVAIAEYEVLHRSEINRLIDNARGIVLDTPHKILDTTSDEFRGILDPRKAELLRQAILDREGESLNNRKYGHLIRAEHFSGLKSVVERCYVDEGIELERAVEDLLKTEALGIKVVRFGSQPSGQPDLELTGCNGTVVLQVTASDDSKKPVSWNKARTVSTSVGFSGQASNFVTIARPGFHEVAIGNAEEIRTRGGQALLLMPLPELIDICLNEVEGKTPSGSVLNTLEDERGHFTAPVE